VDFAWNPGRQGYAPAPRVGGVPFDPEENLFLLPGPVKMHPRVREAMARAPMGHRGAEFTEVNRRLFEGLRRLMGTRHVAVLTGSGTAGMEAAVSNLVHWNDRAVGLDNGEFGARMAGLVERYAGPGALRLSSVWGQGIDLAALETELGKGGVSAVAFTLNESSTAVMNQGREIARLMRRRGMNVQLAEQPAEGEMLLRRDVLVAEEDDEVFRQRAVDFVELPVGERCAEIDAGEFRADDRRELVEADGFVRLALIRHVANAGAVFAGEGGHGTPF